ncbi:MAG: GNAT family N-acetyltransferase, partial [Candidatus Latescibacterota bacterium]
VDFYNTVVGKPFRFENTSTHVLGLESGYEDIWNKRFEKSKRRQTRKAKREGYSVTEARSVDEVRSYYAIYEERCREWRQRLRYPENLFVGLFSRGGGGVRLFLARLGDELVGGHLNFYYKDAVIAWNGVTREIGSGNQASTLLYSECIRDACERGFRQYNLGGSLGKVSLADYKTALGGTPYQYRTAVWRSFAGRVASALTRFVSKR